METGQFSFFTLGAVEPAVLNDLKVDEYGEPIRKRQQHRKSRNGCGNCKKRKVKCDETQPSCLNCEKRGYQCSIIERAKPLKKSKAESGASIEISLGPLAGLSSASPESQSQQLTIPFDSILACQEDLPPLPPWNIDELSLSFSPMWSSSFPSPYADFCPSAQSPNLLRQFFEKGSRITGYNDTHYTIPSSAISSNPELRLRRSSAERELIQHFEDATSKCLTMSSTIWGTRVLSAAMHRDYLMSAVMLISAAHINYSLSRNDPQRRPVLQHFGNALSGLQLALEEELTIQKLDDIVSCPLILMQYSWLYMEIDPLESLNIDDMFCGTVSLFNGLKTCVIVSHGMFTFRESAWAGVLRYSPRIALEEYNHAHKFRERPFFKRIHHQMFCGLGSHDVSCSSSDNHTALQSLSIVLCAIDIARHDLEGSPIAEDVYRYLMTWPPFCTTGFLQLLREDSLTSLCILLYYFAAIVRVANERIWWMRDRALYMFTLLKQRLVGRCELCTGPVIELADAGKSVAAWTLNESTPGLEK